MPTLARLTRALLPLAEHRLCSRRERAEGTLISSQHAFEREERLVLRGLERRRERRRREDVASVLRGAVEVLP